MKYNTNFNVQYYAIYEQGKEEFKNEPEYLPDLDLAVKQIYQEELLYVLGDVGTIDETKPVVEALWDKIKKQDRNDTNTILHWVCEWHNNHSMMFETIADVDVESKEVEASFSMLFSFHDFHILHKRICTFLVD